MFTKNIVDPFTQEVYLHPVKDFRTKKIYELNSSKLHRNCNIGECVGHKKNYVIDFDTKVNVLSYIFKNPNSNITIYGGISFKSFIIENVAKSPLPDVSKDAFKALKEIKFFDDEIQDYENIIEIFKKFELNEENIIEFMKKIRTENICNFVVASVKLNLPKVIKYIYTRKFTMNEDALHNTIALITNFNDDDIKEILENPEKSHVSYFLIISLKTERFELFKYFLKKDFFALENLVCTVTHSPNEYFREFVTHHFDKIENRNIFEISNTLFVKNEKEKFDIFLDIISQKSERKYIIITLLFQSIANDECDFDIISKLVKKLDYNLPVIIFKKILEYRKFEDIIKAITWMKPEQKKELKPFYKKIVTNKPSFADMVALGNKSSVYYNYKYETDIYNPDIDECQEKLKKLYSLIHYKYGSWAEDDD